MLFLISDNVHQRYCILSQGVVTILLKPVKNVSALASHSIIFIIGPDLLRYGSTHSIQQIGHPSILHHNPVWNNIVHLVYVTVRDHSYC